MASSKRNGSKIIEKNFELDKGNLNIDLPSLGNSNKSRFGNLPKIR